MNKFVIFLVLISVGLSTPCYTQNSSELVDIGKNRIGNNNSGAIKAFDMSIKQNRRNSEAFKYRGFTKALMGEFEDAIEDLNTALDINPNDASIYYYRGIVKSLLKDNEGSISDLSTSKKINPLFIDPYAKLRLQDVVSKNKDKLIEHNKKYAATVNKTETPVEKKISEAKKNEEAKLNRRDSLTATSFFQSQFKNLKVKDAVESEKYSYYQRGLTKLSKNDYRSAIEDFNVFIDNNTKDEEPFLNRGIAKYYLHDFISAIDDFNKVIELNKNSAKAYYYRGASIYHNNDLKETANYIDSDNSIVILQDYKSVLDDLNKSIELNPKSAEAYNLRGYVKMELYQKKAACQDFYTAESMGFKDSNNVINRYCK